MAHTSNWHKTEVKIFNKNGSLSPTLAHFRFTNKEMELIDRVFCPKICLFKTDGWHFGTEFLATQKTSISENYRPFKL